MYESCYDEDLLATSPHATVDMSRGGVGQLPGRERDFPGVSSPCVSRSLWGTSLATRKLNYINY